MSIFMRAERLLVDGGEKAGIRCSTPITRVLLCSRGGVNGARVLARLLIQPEIEVVGLVLSTRKFRMRQSVLGAFYFASKRFGLRYLQFLVVSTSLSDLILLLTGRSVEALARARSIPIFHTDDVNGSDAIAFLQRCKANILLSAFFNQKISERVTAQTISGAFNLHPALLPKFKGADPVFFGLLRGSETYGVTLHRISDEFDAGNIIAAEQAAIDTQASLFNINATLFELGSEIFVAAIQSKAINSEGIAQPRRLPNATNDYDSWPTTNDVANLVKKGHALWRMKDLMHLLTEKK